MKGLLGWHAWLGVAALGALMASGDDGPRRHEPTAVASLTVTADAVGQDVRLRADDGTWLAGTLTLPAGAGEHPAVLLVSGAGPHDRDGSVAGHRPFRVLANRLTQAGLAVLRFDDRGVGRSGGDGDAATLERRVADARAALAWLRARKDVDAAHVGVLGHSEGATVAASAAATEDLAFVIALAGPGLSGRELSPLQVASVLRAAGSYPEPTVSALVNAQRHIVDVIASGAERGAITEAVRVGLSTLNALQPAAHRQSASQLARRARRDGEVVSSPWFRSFVEEDPRRAWRRVTCPVLLLNGTVDTQVPARENLTELRRALAHNQHLEIHELVGLNHLLQSAGSGLVSEYGEIAEAMDDGALGLIVDFAKRHDG